MLSRGHGFNRFDAQANSDFLSSPFKPCRQKPGPDAGGP